MTEVAPPLLFDLCGKRVYVAGHTGLAGSAIVRRLASEGCEILTAQHGALDLAKQEATENWIMHARPDAIFLVAGRVGGIYANDTFPVDFLADNLAIALNVMRAAVTANVKKLMFFGSSCVFPRNAPQPMTEDLLLTGSLEPTNEWYAVAKIAGIKLAQAYRRQFGVDFISVMPTNLYGPGDNYHPKIAMFPLRSFGDFMKPRCKVQKRSWYGAPASPSVNFWQRTTLPMPASSSWSIIRTRVFSILVPVKRSALGNLLNSWLKSSAIVGNLCSIPAAPMVHHASYSTFLSFLRWAGLPRRRYAKVCERPTRIFLTKADKCVSDSKGVRRRPTWIGLSNRLILVSLHTRPQD